MFSLFMMTLVWRVSYFGPFSDFTEAIREGVKRTFDIENICLHYVMIKECINFGDYTCMSFWLSVRS